VNALAIDLGSTACKVAVVAIDGTVLGSGLASITTTFGPAGAAEQDAEVVWTSTLAACLQALVEAGPAATADVKAICVASQWSSIVPVAADGSPLAGLHMWFDRRGAARTEALTEGDDQASARWSEIHGFAPSTSLAHILWFQDDADVHRRTAAYLEPMDYLNARFTGVIAATANSAMPLALTDNRELGATTWSRELIERAGVDATRLPPLTPSMSVLAPILPAVADELGLHRDVEVVTGVNDSIAGAFGSGALEPGQATIMMGTTGVLTVHHRVRHVDTARFIVTMPSALDDRYYVVAEGGLGGKLVELALDEIVGAGSGRGPDPAHFDEVMALAAASAPGAGGVLFLPWVFGSLSPALDQRHRGALLGLSISTSRGDLARAVLEGISLQMRWLTDEVEAALATSFDRIRFVGGGATSDVWSAITADVIGRPIDQVADPRHAVSRGAALIAFVSTGRLTLDELPELVPIRRRYEPDPDLAPLYDERLDVMRGLHAVLAEPVSRLTT
jgi:xylulokinase